MQIKYYIIGLIKREIMRQGIVVLGFFIIVLIVIAGCTSTQSGAATGSNSQGPALQTTNHIMTVEDYWTPIFECKQPAVDPKQLQKFLPNVPGYDRRYGQNISGMNYMVQTKEKNDARRIYDNIILESYTISGKLYSSKIIVELQDLGPCAGSVEPLLNIFDYGTRDYNPSGTLTETTVRINNFHGYPAVHIFITNKTSGYLVNTQYHIFVSNRLNVIISIDCSFNECPLSESEAEIEKIANAIDFKGLTSSV